MQKNNQRRKSPIDLEYGVWLRLSKYSRKMKMTLSETITYMIDERESKAQFEKSNGGNENQFKEFIKIKKTSCNSCLFALGLIEKKFRVFALLLIIHKWNYFRGMRSFVSVDNFKLHLLTCF